MHLKFIRWEGDIALFKEANALDQIIVFSGLALLCKVLNIKDGNIIIIKAPDRLVKEKKDSVEVVKDDGGYY